MRLVQVAVVCVAGLFAVLGATKPENVVVQVVDASGEVIPTAVVELSAMDDYECKSRRAISSEAGTFRLAGTDVADGLNLVASAKGYAPQLLRYRDRVPSIISVSLRRARTVSGVVVDEGGRPIADASALLKVFNWQLGDQLQSLSAEVGAKLTTDQEGRFSFTEAPSDANGAVVHVWRSGWAPTTFEGPYDTKAEKLADVPLRVTLDAGRQVSGQVLDSNGTPVVGATVKLQSQIARISTQTDQSGNYILRNIPVRSSTLIARLPGKGEKKVVLPKGQINDQLVQNIDLPPVQQLKVKVVDVQGHPAAGVRVWAVGSFELNGVEGVTDAQGEVLLESAPTLGYASVKGMSQVIGFESIIGNEVVIKLRQKDIPIRLTGSVSDEKTGGRVGKFVVTMMYNGQEGGWLPKEAHLGPQFGVEGRFDLLFDESHVGRPLRIGVKISAEGYEPQMPALAKVEQLGKDRTVMYEIKLRPVGK